MEQDKVTASSFIRVIEIWVPESSGANLVLSSADYGGLKAFSQVSAETSFALGEGLPGKAWQSQRPLVLKEFEEATFVRTAAARDAGLTSGVALPVFMGGECKAVVVMLCGDVDAATGAIEVWQDDGLSGMALVEGYYGAMERFEWISKQVRFPLGVGLPGGVWKSHQPTIMPDLANSSSFLRAANAKEAGIATGVGIPFYAPSHDEDIAAVLVFLSAKQTPLAQRFEVWQKSTETNTLWLAAGITAGSTTVDSEDHLNTIAADAGPTGRALTTGVPQLTSAADHGHGNTLLAIPIERLDGSQCAVVMYFMRS
ncbi:GAF domain-containing protein [Halioxenophilus aromaticivorans]|uniref:GAF domain-containing protein n=1 Tax=Halioxenophilus aromaticivorans TaxID=1306992 RepID=A0AAV3U979_9ALTE